MNNDGTNEAARNMRSMSASMMTMQRFRQPLVAYLVSSLEVDDRWVRMMAAELLGTVGDSQVTDSLKPLMADPDSDVRIIAAKSLSLLSSPRGGLTTRQADYCGNCMIRLLANEALEQLKMQEDPVGRHPR
jgi:HEAT repeat protein